MSQPTEIRRRPDGSIDTAYYARIGRALHGEAVRETAARLVWTPPKQQRPSPPFFGIRNFRFAR